MITNFDYLKKDSKFSRFADVAISAEKIILMDPEASILNSRRAMEFAIKWMYSVDSELEMPYQDNLQSLMNAEEYRQIVGSDFPYTIHSLPSRSMSSIFKFTNSPRKI